MLTDTQKELLIENALISQMLDVCTVLTQAAKAYGIPHVFDPMLGQMSHQDYAKGWNPLWCNDDCFRMETKLKFNIAYTANGVMVSCADILINLEFSKFGGNEELTRRAASTLAAYACGLRIVDGR